MKREWLGQSFWARASDAKVANEVVTVDIHEALVLSPWCQDQYIQPSSYVAVETFKFSGSSSIRGLCLDRRLFLS